MVKRVLAGCGVSIREKERKEGFEIGVIAREQESMELVQGKVVSPVALELAYIGIKWERKREHLVLNNNGLECQAGKHEYVN